MRVAAPHEPLSHRKEADMRTRRSLLTAAASVWVAWSGNAASATEPPSRNDWPEKAGAGHRSLYCGDSANDITMNASLPIAIHLAFNRQCTLAAVSTRPTQSEGTRIATRSDRATQ